MQRGVVHATGRIAVGLADVDARYADAGLEELAEHPFLVVSRRVREAGGK
jgi:hypothetical protein